MGKRIPRLVGEHKEQVLAARRVQGTLTAKALARQEKKMDENPRSVEHIYGRPFRDPEGVLRKPNGTFACDSVPKHKRALTRPG